MPESLTPPQGLIAVSDQKVIYGLPVGLKQKAEFKIKILTPPKISYSGEFRVILVGEYQLAPKPPIEENPLRSGSITGTTQVSIIKDSLSVNYGEIVIQVINPPVMSCSGSISMYVSA